MHQTDMLEWDEPDAAEAGMPPAQMILELRSDDVLQVTITKTALDVFNNLSQVRHFCGCRFVCCFSAAIV